MASAELKNADAMRTTPTNLLVRLHRWAHRQSENFTTEAFTHVLEHLVDAEPNAARDMLEWLTARQITVTQADLRDLDIRTQSHANEHGIPDVRIFGPDLDIVIEVKLDAGLSAAQAMAYRRAQDREGRARRALVGLTGARPDGLDDVPIVLRTWAELGDKLAAMSFEELSITAHEVDQLLGLLRYQGLLRAPRVDSPLADALEAHRRRLASNPEMRSPLNTRLRSLDRFAEWPELEPLRAHLQQLTEVLLDAGCTEVRVESGQSGASPWVGLSINQLEHFIHLDLDNPRGLTFTHHRSPLAPGSPQPTMGRYRPDRGKLLWCHDVDLSEEGYFEAKASEQVAMLRAFVISCLEHAAAL